MKLIQQCTLMGFPWTTEHPQTKRKLYLRLSFSFLEEFAQAWEHFREEFAFGQAEMQAAEKQGQASGEQARGELGQPGRPGQPAGSRASEASPRGAARGEQARGELGQPGKDGKDGKDGRQSKQKSPLEEQWFNAMKFKKQTLETTGRATWIWERIDSHAPDWAWADNAENKGKLEEQMATVRDAHTSFGIELLMHEFGILKKKYSREAVSGLLTEALAAKPKIDGLEKMCGQLLKRAGGAAA